MNRSNKLLAHEFANAVVASTPPKDESTEIFVKNKLKLYLESVKQYEQMLEGQKIDLNEHYSSGKFF
ncbi:hypothetical protein [Bacillus sp. (in: firmicutes)]|uniref:hypothetical protein n=1 Tax=Bacillus sp. TaxID=1409 RepID=UPI000EC484AA|nr:hypothetical protein [Bacillus sp. (in: firmicutes)]HCO80145.1 hypothetical protein [Bacillus sp. (in: firmicutes)]